MSHPFVLEPPETAPAELNAGDPLELGLVLIGRAIPLAPYFLAACRDMASLGLGRGRGRCRLTHVAAEDPGNPAGRLVYEGAQDLLAPVVPSWSSWDLDFPPGVTAGRIAVEFLTPTRLRQDGELVVRPEFTTPATALLRRLSVLAEVHCGARAEIPAREALAATAGVKVTESSLHWRDWERHSARQGTRMALGGFVGRITFEGTLGPCWPLLRLGEVLHVGKGTAFGLGKYRIGQRNALRTEAQTRRGTAGVQSHSMGTRCSTFLNSGSPVTTVASSRWAAATATASA